MKITIDIITGFLEGGKTTFLQELLQRNDLSIFKKIVLVVCEEGVEEYEEEVLQNRQVQKVVLEKEEDLTDSFFVQIAEKYAPDHILIEYNGTWDIATILERAFPPGYLIRTIAYLGNTEVFENQLHNMASLIQPQILNSDVVLLNRFEKEKKEQARIAKDVKNINANTEVVFLHGLEDNNLIKEYFGTLNGSLKRSLHRKKNIEAGICGIIILAIMLFVYSIEGGNYIQSVVTIFLSIIMQAIPFLLLGAFISAGIQIFASTGWIIRQIEKNSWYSFLIAAVAGFFLPVCDCGMVPIVSGLLRKNAPLPQTMTFWLSSSAVSPIVIVSMLYAFPGQLDFVAYRIITGIIIGVMTGIVLKIRKIETKDVIKENSTVQKVGKDILALRYHGIRGKIEALFTVAQIEFFRVAEFVIIGSVFSAALQTLLPKTFRNYIGNNIVLQFTIMFLAAIVISICSTSNVFIGRSFSNNISMVPILSYIVLGPMLDLGNMVMLSGILKKKFLLFIMLLVMLEGTLIFGVLAMLYR